MNTRHIPAYFLLALILLFSRCTPEEMPLNGDNYLIDFALTLSEKRSYPARISGEKVVVAVPRNLLQSPFGVRYRVSKGATITPDPKSISDWSSAPKQLSVQASDGSVRTYTVTITPQDVAATEVDPSGKSTAYLSHLVTDDDVKQLAASGANVLIGDLIVGAPEGKDSISDLSALSALKEVRYRLVINPTYKGDLSELTSLECVGELVINGTPPRLKEITLEKLKSLVLGLTISDRNNKQLESISMPELIECGKISTRAPRLHTLSLPKVQTLAGLGLESDSIRSIALDALVALKGDLSIKGGSAGKFEKLACPSLTHCEGTIKLSKLSALTTINMPRLQSAKGIDLSETLALQELELSKLEQVEGDLKLKFSTYNKSNSTLKAIDLSALRTVGNLLSINGAESATSLLLPALESVGNKIELTALPQLSEFKIGNPKQVKELTFDTVNLSGTLDLSGMDDQKLTLKKSWKGLDKLILPKGLKSLIFEEDYNNGVQGGLPTIEGTMELEKFEFTNCSAESIILPFTSITGELRLNGSGLVRINAPHLTKVGSLIISNQPEKLQTITMPELQEAERISVEAPVLEQLNFPKLKTLGKLEMDLWRGNQTLTSLNGFSSLESLKSIKIRNHKKLTDYSGLKKAVESGGLSEKTWGTSNVVGNGYNPTFADLKAGRFTKPTE